MSTITVTIVFALPERAIEIELRLAAGATVADALAGFPAEKVRDIALSQAPVGIFGRRVEQDHVLTSELLPGFSAKLSNLFASPV